MKKKHIEKKKNTFRGAQDVNKHLQKEIIITAITKIYSTKYKRDILYLKTNTDLVLRVKDSHVVKALWAQNDNFYPVRLWFDHIMIGKREDISYKRLPLKKGKIQKRT